MFEEVYLQSYVIAITVHQYRKLHTDRKQQDHLQDVLALNKVSHLAYPHHLARPLNKVRYHLAWHLSPVSNHLASLVVQVAPKDLQR